jgi:serine/threonine protein kinase
MKTSRAFIVKLADFGTANLMDSNGVPVTIANFTTLENIPPEFMILGDAAKQGHTQDSFALGLCMFHLFTGQGPYEEILENVKCPKILKRKLTRIWMKSPEGFEVIRSVILGDLCEDEDGNFDGEVDETLFDTLYRYLVLFGIPEIKQQMKDGSKVWSAINSCLVSQDHPPRPTSRPVRKAALIKPSESENDTLQFKFDSEKFSLKHGNNIHISRARETLLKTEGAMDLLQYLVNFDPNARASVLDIINSRFMIPLRQQSGAFKGDNTVLYSYMAYSGCKVK